MSDPRPHVLLVSHEVTRTGAVAVGLHVLDALVAAGYRTTVVLRDGGSGVERFAAADRCIVEPGGRVRAALRKLERRRSMLPGLGNRVIARRVIAEVRPDLVYANAVGAGDYVRVAFGAGIPSIFHVHELAAVGWYGIRVNGVNGVPPTGYDIVVPSWDAAIDVAMLTGRLPEQVHLHPSPVDVLALAERALPDAQRPVSFGGCGLVDPWKGPDLWSEVAARVVERVPDARCQWVGTGSQLEHHRAVVRESGNADRIEFVGEVADATANIRRSRVFGLTSRIESQSLVAVEAMASGVPVVAFDVGAVRHTVGDAGVLIPPFDVEAFSDAVTGLLGDEARREELGERGRARAERFGLDRFRERTQRLVESRVGKHV